MVLRTQIAKFKFPNTNWAFFTKFNAHQVTQYTVILVVILPTPTFVSNTNTNLVLIFIALIQIA